MLLLNLKTTSQLSWAYEQSSVLAISQCLCRSPESADQESRPSVADLRIKTVIPFYSSCCLAQQRVWALPHRYPQGPSTPWEPWG